MKKLALLGAALALALTCSVADAADKKAKAKVRAETTGIGTYVPAAAPKKQSRSEWCASGSGSRGASARRAAMGCPGY